MDVNVSVLLLRDQLGTVIEQAMAAAVETVLGEMLKVVSNKFEEFRKEITAKEKENESIRQMLEISRCQMKTMRKYLNAVSARDERYVSANQRKFGKQNEPNRTLRAYVGQLQPPSDFRQTRTGGDGSFTVNGKAQRLLNENQSACLSDNARAAQPWNGTTTNAQECATRESQDTRGPGHREERFSRVKEEYRPPREGRDGYHGKEGGCESELSQEGCAETLDSETSSLHKTDISTMATVRASPQAKEETSAAEIEVICIKEEPAELETHTLESPQPPDHRPGQQPDPHSDHRPGQRPDPHSDHRPGQRPDPHSDHRPGQRPDPHSDHRPGQGSGRDTLTEATLTLSSSTCWAGQRRAQWEASALQAQQQQQRAELKRRSQVRRRERERSLPQPLQAALERERREKTRIRVARWRAKRKMQAGLLASRLDYQQASGALQCHQQCGGLLYENSALYPPLQVGVGQDLTDAPMQPAVTSTPQGILGADSELFP